MPLLPSSVVVVRFAVLAVLLLLLFDCCPSSFAAKGGKSNEIAKNAAAAGKPSKTSNNNNNGTSTSTTSNTTIASLNSTSTNNNNTSKDEEGESTTTKEEEEAEDDEDSFVLELNPDYVGGGRREEDEDDDEDDEEEEEVVGNKQNNNNNATAAKLSKAEISKMLMKSKASNRTTIRSRKKRLIKFVGKHYWKVTVAAGLFAFRNEIRRIMWKLISVPRRDPDSGKVVGGERTVSVTSVIKILVLIDVLYRIQSAAKRGGGNGGDKNKEVGDQEEDEDGDGRAGLSTLLIAMLMSSQRNPFVAFLLSQLLPSGSGKNSAYIPPVEQHYTFEQINIRYEKDAMALDKAMMTTTTMHTGIIRPTMASGGGGGTGGTNCKSDESAGSSSKPTVGPSKKNDNAAFLRSALGKVHLLGGSGRSSGGGNNKASVDDDSSSSLAKAKKAAAKAAANYNGTVIVMDMTGLGTSVTQLPHIRDQVSFLLSTHLVAREIGNNGYNGNNNATTATGGTSSTAGGAAAIEEAPSAGAKNDDDDDDGAASPSQSPSQSPSSSLEVVVLLESPGGQVAEYGMASQQILRMRNRGIKVTVCVDKVAASGGYMMACTSSPGRLFAAPFAMLGSIGVVGNIVNFNEVLRGWKVKPLVFRGGRDKAPVGAIGEVTRDGVAKIQSMVDDTHAAFKRHVAESRPAVADRIEEIATGDVWLGYDALKRGLVDRIVTSDEYIGERLADGARVLKLVHVHKSKFPFAPPTTSSTFIPTNSNRARHSLISSLLPAGLRQGFRTLLARRLSELLLAAEDHRVVNLEDPYDDVVASSLSVRSASGAAVRSQNDGPSMY